MMRTLFKSFAIFLLVYLSSVLSINAQNFSCSFGKQPACLDYSDKVCSSFAKCVDQNAVCFDSFQCGYEGFTCKSNVTELAEKYDNLVGKFNNLIDMNEDLTRDYNDVVEDLNSAKWKIDEIKTCLQNAVSMDDAQYCSYL